MGRVDSLGLFLNTATIIVFPFGTFAKAMGQEFHSGRAKISLAFTIHNLTAALCVPLAGRLVDRYGPRRVLLPFTAFLGLILVSSRVLSGAIWQLYVFYLALGVVSGGAGAMSYTDVVSHWFDRRRGLARSVMMLGMGLGAIVIPSVARKLVATSVVVNEAASPRHYFHDFRLIAICKCFLGQWSGPTKIDLAMRRGRKIAKVAMARKLAVRLYWMMRKECLFKGAATRASVLPGPFQDFYQRSLAKGIKPTMARLTLARKIAAITLTLWKKGENFDADKLKSQAA